MKTFTKHILLLALMLFGVAGAAWADRAPQKFTGPVAFNSLVVGDTLAEGFSFTGLSTQTLIFEGNRHKQNGGTPGEYSSSVGAYNVTGYGGDNPAAIILLESSTYTPVDESGQDGNAWVVTATNNNYVRIAGIYIAPDPTVPALDETTGHWNFLMPGSNKVVKAVLYDSIVLGPHVTVAAQPTPAFISYTRPGIGGDSTVLYYDPNTTQPSTFGFEAAANDGNGRNFAFWADDQTNHNTFRSFGNLSELTCGQRFVAVYPDNYTLALFTQSGGTLSLDGESVDSVYNITFYHGGSSDIMEITIPASRMPYDTTFDYGSTYVMGAEVTEASGKLSKFEGQQTVTVRISGAFEGYGSYSCELEGGTYDMWSITCEASTQPKTPYGISKTGDGTYSVMEGLTVNVTATPDSAHYLSAIDGHDTVGNYATGYSFVMPSGDKDLMADFAAKPTLTLAQTDGGTLEAIVPQGEPVLLTTIIPTASAISTGTQTNDTVTVTLAGQLEWDDGGWTVQFYEGCQGSVSVTAAAGFDIAYYKFYFYQGDPYIVSEETAAVYPYFSIDYFDQLIYSQPNGQGQYLGKRAVTRIEVYATTRANVIASSTPNTYIIDYGTPVTVVATPDAQHYLVSFSDDDPATERNSNIAVEKTYDSVIADIPLSANFQAKPTLTLTANDGGTLEIVPAGGPVWGDGVSNLILANNYTADGITFTSTNGSDIPNHGQWSAYSSKHFHFTSESGNFSRIEMVLTGNNNYNDWNNAEGWTVDANTAVWEGDANEVVIEKCTTYVKQITFVRAAANVVRTAEPNTYIIDYGTEVTVVATPDATHYLATLGEELVNSNDSIHRTFTMTAPVNLEANFRAKPVLTLAANDTTWGKVTLAGSNNTIDTIYSNTMASQELFNQMTVVDNNGDCGSAHGQWIFDYFPKYTFCSSQAADDWLITPAIAMEAGKTYTVTVDGNCTNSSYPERIEVKAATEATAEALSAGVQVIASTDVNSQMLTQYTGTFTPTADGNYRIGIHAISDMDRDELYVRNLSITADAIPAAIPAGVAKIDDTTYRVDYGTQVVAKATPAQYRHLESWSNEAAVNETLTDTFTVNADMTLTANFAKDAPELAWIYNEQPMQENDLSVYYGFEADTIAKIAFTATKDFLKAYKNDKTILRTSSSDTNIVSFDANDDPVVKDTGSVTIYLVHDGSLFAYDSIYFTLHILQPATLTLAVNDTLMGSLTAELDGNDSVLATAEMGVYSVVPNAQVSLTAIPAENHYMQGWDDEENAVNSNKMVERTITVAGDSAITALFAHKPTLVIAVNDTNLGRVMMQTVEEQLPAGIVAVEENTYIVDYGQTVKINAEAIELHHVAYWGNLNDDTLGEAAYADFFVGELFPATSTLTLTVVQDTVATVNFSINSYDVTATVAEGQEERGTIKIAYTDVYGEAHANADTIADTVTAQGATLTTLVATPANTCFDFAYWKVGDEEIATDTLTVTVAAEAVAYFVYHAYAADTLADECDKFVWYGRTFISVPQSSPTHVYKTVKDECDSVVTLVLTFRYSNTGDTVASECDEFAWYDSVYTLTPETAPTHTYVNAAGCDSVVTLNLTVRHSNTGVEKARSCDRYTWQGTVYTHSNTSDQRTLTNIENCDSVVTLDLDIYYHHDTTVHWQTSGDFVWGKGETYEETFTTYGTYNRTIKTVDGCDSNLTIVLAFLPKELPLPKIYNMMDVALMIHHYEGGSDEPLEYIYYRWYKNGVVVDSGEYKDSYSENGNLLNGCFYLEISTDPDHKYWAQSNEICLTNVGIDGVENIDLTVAPNPVVRGQRVSIAISGVANLQGATLTVYDAQGRKAIEQNDLTGFDAPQTAGIYTVRLMLNDGRMATRKVVVR